MTNPKTFNIAIGCIGVFGASVLAIMGSFIIASLVLALTLSLPPLVRAGVSTALAGSAIVFYASSGYILAYAPGLSGLSLPVLLLVVMGGLHGAMLIFKHRISFSAPAIFAILFVFISLMAFVASLGSGSYFAARAGLSLIFPLAAACAVVGVVASAPSVYERTLRRNTIALVTIFSILINSIAAVRQAIGGFTAGEQRLVDASESTYLVGQEIRSMGLMQTNQDFSLLSSCLVAGFLLAGLYATGRLRLLLWLVATTLGFAGLLGLNRTALIASIFTILFSLTFWGKGKIIPRIIKYTITGALVVFLGGSLLFRLEDDRIAAAASRALTLTSLSPDKSFNERIGSVYPRAIDSIINHPLGLGAGAAGPISQVYPELAPMGSFQTDNGYLMIGVQLGIFGLIFFALFLVATALWLVQVRSVFTVGAATTLVALMVAMMSGQYWALTAPMALLASWVGLGISERLAPAKSDVPQRVSSSHSGYI
ncbi:O-antigen ligase family protein [Kocuria nitroreducens]|uniref:O-antigen ligase family protein n=1 Tax=Kocuria nitroreducens TaxID=3058914 RepID=UPI0036D93557